jgi:RNA polymerase primary sigma factor
MIFDMEIQYLESKTPKLLEDGNPEINQKEMEVGLNEVLSILTFNEKKVLELRFGLNGNEIHTLRACAKEIGVTPERTRQIESNALYKLRRNNIPKKIRELIETANGQ